jgi:uncharacterized protein Usg
MYNITEAVNKLALSAHLGHSCETGCNKYDSSYYSKQNSKFYHRVKFYLYFLQVYDKRNYRITGNFCSVKFLQFWTNKKTFNFCGLFFLQIENLGAGKKMVCIKGSSN